MAIDEEVLALAEPDSAEESSLEAWYMDDTDLDQRLPHRKNPNKPCSVDTLRALGVLSWSLDADNYEEDAKFKAVKEARGYNYQDLVNCSPDTMPGFDEKIKMFYEEHIHADEEIRFVLDGSGYFDVRDLEDKWIRIECTKGTMIVLPEGMYHRFTLDTKNYIKALRLFVGEPVWTPHNRPQDEHPSRIKYLESMETCQTTAATA
ncbi:unnamed protein product [Ostreobium quekettii]|uniref:Acireductone dioxygenase n=1 Tax=Ostreobium quekettii TaxID=121088 RepID=A0A8S1J822_9CHLO|nr:unnamed protein product [Ostreobium quekettii]|eukprot:evm.model.scf_1914.3 EVM.evm.TU.scf_1914.3   scf_1914:17182-21537(+)